MTYRLVIFDFDGTLADSAGWMRGVLNDLARRHRFREVGGDVVEALRGEDTRAILAHLGVAPWRLPFIARDLRRRAARDAHLIPVFPGVRELLEELAGRGVTVAIVSSNAEATVRAVLGPDSAARIACYACGASLFGKRAKIRRVLRRTGCARQHAIAIGDEVRDLEAATAERIATGAVSWGYATPALLRAQRPTAMFESIDQLRRALAGAG